MTNEELVSILRRLEELRPELNDGAGPLITKHQNFVIDFIKADFEEIYGTVLVACGNCMQPSTGSLTLVK